jgi:hypothetical protein
VIRCFNPFLTFYWKFFIVTDSSDKLNFTCMSRRFLLIFFLSLSLYHEYCCGVIFQSGMLLNAEFDREKARGLLYKENIWKKGFLQPVSAKLGSPQWKGDVTKSVHIFLKNLYITSYRYILYVSSTVSDITQYLKYSTYCTCTIFWNVHCIMYCTYVWCPKI